LATLDSNPATPRERAEPKIRRFDRGRNSENGRTNPTPIRWQGIHKLFCKRRFGRKTKTNWRLTTWTDCGKRTSGAGADVSTGRELGAPLTGHTDEVFAIAVAPDGKTLFSGASEETIRLWGLADGRFRATWHAEDEIRSLAFSPDGKTLALALHGGRIRLWDVAQEMARPAMLGDARDGMDRRQAHWS
jgi:WD40 repeat protein